MAAYFDSRSQSFASYRNFPGLKDLFLDGVKNTGKTLGHGAVGVVEEVVMCGKIYVAKKFDARLMDKDVSRVIERFASVHKVMSKINHRNIVHFLGLTSSERIHPRLVSEKVDVNLETLIKSLSFPLNLRLLQDITNGLVYMHSQMPPIVHCDLTARNVLINKASMTAKIADLGNALVVDLAKLFDALRQFPETLPYMPPEINQHGLMPDPSFDMFSFGHLTLYVIIRECPGDLLPVTYINPQRDGRIARTEVQRRGKYIMKLDDTLTNEHILTKVILQCLNDIPENRYLPQHVQRHSVALSQYDIARVPVPFNCTLRKKYVAISWVHQGPALIFFIYLLFRPKATNVLQQVHTVYREGNTYLDIVESREEQTLEEDPTYYSNTTTEHTGESGGILNRRIEEFKVKHYQNSLIHS